MRNPEYESLTRHHEDPDLFREAINFTSAETRLSSRLIEKDYFCTLLLHYLAEVEPALVFKGGTCLAKVHAGFYRLSEDLDFVIPTPLDASRSTRSRKAERLKTALAALPVGLAFEIVDPFRGANNSTQYLSTLSYASLLSGQKEVIKIEVGLREPLLTSVFRGSARTSLLNPISGKPMVDEIAVSSISFEEAMAEKLRAALSRREAAIRDFYDIDYAVRNLKAHLFDGDLIELVRQKLLVPGNMAVDVSEGRLISLRQQLDSRLKPVLRSKDFEDFDLDRAFKAVAGVATVIAGGRS